MTLCVVASTPMDNLMSATKLCDPRLRQKQNLTDVTIASCQYNALRKHVWAPHSMQLQITHSCVFGCTSLQLCPVQEHMCNKVILFLFWSLETLQGNVLFAAWESNGQ